MYVLVKWSFNPDEFLQVHLVIKKKDLSKVVGKPKLFDCVLIIYVKELISSSY